jgi:hypothetical protein
VIWFSFQYTFTSENTTTYSDASRYEIIHKMIQHRLFFDRANFEWLMPFSGRAMTCWEKAHVYYIQQGLFGINPKGRVVQEGKPLYCNHLSYTPFLYLKREEAMGIVR